MDEKLKQQILEEFTSIFLYESSNEEIQNNLDSFLKFKEILEKVLNSKHYVEEVPTVSKLLNIKLGQ